MLRALDLSEEQRQELRASMEEVRGQFREIHQNLFAAKKSLHEAVLRGDDESILRDLAEAVGDAEGDVAFVRAQQFAGIVAILDDEQKLKMQQFLEEAESRREGRKERFRDEG
jgi:Spy/CpxP family protein refolding chaperone